MCVCDVKIGFVRACDVCMKMSEEERETHTCFCKINNIIAHIFYQFTFLILNHTVI